MTTDKTRSSVMNSASELLCGICQDELCDTVTTNCYHDFCKCCISTWLSKNKSCPICRATVDHLKREPNCEGYIPYNTSTEILEQHNVSIFYYSTGVVLECILVDNYPYGTVKFTSDEAVWIGDCFTGDLANTLFTNSATQSSYKGEWKNGLRHGHGVLFTKSGNSYAGDWVKGKLNGLGTYVFKSGAMYTGEWRNNQMHGKGTYEINGKREKGIWIDGKKKPKLNEVIKEKVLARIVRV